MMDPNKVSFITCVNKEEWYSECLLYLQHLELPPGMEAEYIPIRGAASMAAGYNEGMRRSQAKYKVYLHQDTLVVNKHLVQDLLQLFADPAVGLVGVIGCRSLPKTGVWWDGMRPYGRVLHACEAESTVDTVCRQPEGQYMEVEALDGLLLAAQQDIPWREDLFTGWHFYDISACKEFARRGYRVIVPQQEDFWCIHCPKEKPTAASYWEYRKIFLREYGAELHPEV